MIIMEIFMNLIMEVIIYRVHGSKGGASKAKVWKLKNLKLKNS